MKKLKGLSPIGYAIATIILVAMGMIISAPFIVEQNKAPNIKQTSQTQNIEELPQRNYPIDSNEVVSQDDLRQMVEQLNSKIEALERKISETKTDRYVCSIEGGLNEDGVVVPIDPNNPPAKFVFACEYRK